jgi:hypothetical protein
MKTLACTIMLLLYSACLFPSNSPVVLPRLEAALDFNGIPDESFWVDSYTITNFRQVEPRLGDEATEYPSVYVTYDAQYLYIGAIIPYSDPEIAFARVTERDIALDRDDFIEIHLDSYNDHTNSLVFSTNPLGARYDYEVSRNGQDINRSWNTFWDVKTNRTLSRWTVEMRIPFSSLRYEPTEQQIMRLKAVIKYKNKNERLLFPLHETERLPVIYQYRNAQEIVLSGLPASNPVFITPYVKGDIVSINTLNLKGTAYETNTEIFEEKGFLKASAIDKVLSNVGLDLKFKPRTNQTLDVTLNTDFAQAEADDRIINITRFPIFLPEKRQFFLENADLFNSNQFNHRLFHSRRIGLIDGQTVPIIGGLRFTGGSDRLQYGVLSMQTQKQEGLGSPSEHMSVVRAKKTVGSLGSYIGFMGAARLSDSHYNYLTAIDGNLRIKDNLLSRFTLASTFDKMLGDWKYMYGMTINTFTSNGFGIEYRYRDYGEGFSPALGFVTRPNTKRLTLNHGWRKTYKNHPWLQRLAIGNWITRFWESSTNRPEFFQTNIYFSAVFTSGYSFGMFAPVLQTDHLFAPWAIAKGVNVPSGFYSMWKMEPFFSTGNAFPYTISGALELGEFYGGHHRRIKGTVNYDFSKRLQAEMGATLNRFSFPDNYSENGTTRAKADLYYTRLKLAFSSHSFLNSFIQYDSSAKSLGWNLRFRYTPNEATNLYVVYNHNMNTDRERLMPGLPVTESMGFSVKFSKTLIR